MDPRSATPTADNVVRLAEKVSDSRYDDVQSTFDDVLGALATTGRWAEEGFVAKHVIIVALDDRDGAYNTKLRTSSMKISEAVALLEVAKQVYLRDLGV